VNILSPHPPKALPHTLIPLLEVPKKLESQKENIFHSRCLINNKLCSLIIGSGSCVNVASSRVVDKFGLKTILHAKPYKLSWLSEEGEIKVDKQIFINFSISNYKDEVICDLVPMVMIKPFCLLKDSVKTNFPLKMQYKENLGNQSVDMAKVKCKIYAWIVVGKFIQINTWKHKTQNHQIQEMLWTMHECMTCNA